MRMQQKFDLKLPHHLLISPAETSNCAVQTTSQGGRIERSAAATNRAAAVEARTFSPACLVTTGRLPALVPTMGNGDGYAATTRANRRVSALIHVAVSRLGRVNLTVDANRILFLIRQIVDRAAAAQTRPGFRLVSSRANTEASQGRVDRPQIGWRAQHMNMIPLSVRAARSFACIIRQCVQPRSHCGPTLSWLIRFGGV